MRFGRGRFGCLGLVLLLFLWPFVLIYMLYKFAWNKPATQRGKWLSVGGVTAGLLVLIIIGSVTGGSSNQNQNQQLTSTTSTAPTQAATSAPTSVVPTTEAPIPSATPTHTGTHRATHKATYAPTHQATHAPAAPAPTSQAAPAPTTQQAAPSCYPTTSGGNCYEPGEYCPKADHGMSGVAGDGKSIICRDNNGWRWEDV